jgi:hypothetical protein
MRDQELCWKTVAVRYGVDLARETRAQLKEAGALPLPDEPNPLRKALEVCIEVEAFREWAKTGFMLVSLSRADALALARTDPPSWLIANPLSGGQTAPLAVLFDGVFGLIVNWRACSHLWLEENYDPFDDDEASKRFVQNVGFALLERPEGLDIREHRPSAKAMRKQGRKHYPTVQYIIQAARDLHPPPPREERGPRDEGWTQGVRTLVRGHWRLQPYGPNNSLRKAIWIRPFWRGPEDAPVSIHPIRLFKPGST